MARLRSCSADGAAAELLPREPTEVAGVRPRSVRGDGAGGELRAAAAGVACDSSAEGGGGSGALRENPTPQNGSRYAVVALATGLDVTL